MFVDKLLENHQMVTIDGMKWTKQLRGEAVDRNCTIDDAHAFMRAYTREVIYDPRNDNCHSA